MLYGAEIDELLAAWQQRIQDKSYPQEYRDALVDCVYELKTLLDSSIEDQLDAIQRQSQVAVSRSENWYY